MNSSLFFKILIEKYSIQEKDAFLLWSSYYNTSRHTVIIWSNVIGLLNGTTKDEKLINYIKTHFSKQSAAQLCNNSKMLSKYYVNKHGNSSFYKIIKDYLQESKKL